MRPYRRHVKESDMGEMHARFREMLMIIYTRANRKIRYNRESKNVIELRIVVKWQAVF